MMTLHQSKALEYGSHTVARCNTLYFDLDKRTTAGSLTRCTCIYDLGFIYLFTFNEMKLSHENRSVRFCFTPHLIIKYWYFFEPSRKLRYSDETIDNVIWTDV